MQRLGAQADLELLLGRLVVAREQLAERGARSSSPSGRSRLVTVRAAVVTSATCLSGSFARRGDLLVGRRAAELRGQLALGARDARSRSTMWTGMRIVRDLFATPRWTAWRIHHVA